jgi:regulator of replication initiation timing
LQPLHFEHQADDLALDLISGHLLSPLFKEYEATLASQHTEITALRFELQKSIDQNAALASENELLLTDLSLKQREYLKLVNDRKDYPQIWQEGADPERIQLLTEENHILF